MAFALTIDGKQVQWDQDTLTGHLNEIASSTKAQACWKFVEQIKTSAQVILNQLKAQVIETDDKNLNALFRRAVRNHDSLYPEQQTDPVPLYNKHYQKPPFLIPNTDLIFDIRKEEVTVTAELEIHRDSNHTSLILDAQDHDVLEVSVNGKALKDDQYVVTGHEIIIQDIPEDQSFKVRIVSKINPFKNESGEGLYQCKEWLTTQCESEGARRIFPTLDRPDVLSRYTTTIIADPEMYPARISNGNLISEKTGDDGRATITWNDPFPKPSYLFAMVMGEFSILQDHFVTRSGRKVQIEVFMEKGKETRGQYSLFALKKAMEYEEKFYDREYDLDSLKMVAMPDFNAGAMENKGLIIFNESCILVDPECASDMDYFWVALVISHEYCHNWSGNRVTVRNWFELALKEAFTDFRCSQFMLWMFGDELVRPHEADELRERQFPEDAIAGAHPIQVESYVTSGEIYDNTTYVKGREIFRMLKTLLDRHSEDGFRLAQNAYFERYDGQAVTFRELLTTLQEVSGVDLTQFERWFHQPGTPTVKAQLEYDEEKKVAKIHLQQNCPHPKTKEEQLPLHIPLSVELLDAEGHVIVPTHLTNLKEESQTLVFEGISKKPIPVFHHDFSAPIHMEYAYEDNELKTILQHEKDPFARGEAGDIYLKHLLRSAYDEAKKSGEVSFPEDLIDFFSEVLMSKEMSPLAKAEFLEQPSLRSIVEKDDVYDFQAAVKAKSSLHKKLSEGLEEQLVQLLEMYPEPKKYDPKSDHFKDDIAIRELRNNCYDYLSSIPNGKYNDIIINRYRAAENFNNQFSLLKLIIGMEDPRCGNILQDFFEQWKNDGTILNNWIVAQAGSSRSTAETLEKIYNSEGFLKTNPDHMRSLIRGFVNNLGVYHQDPTANYKYVTDKILEFGKINPSVASSSLAKAAYKDYAKLPPNSKALMKEQLERLTAPNVDKAIRSVAETYLR